MSIGQRRALSDFLNTIAAAWLATGVIAPIFASNYPQANFLLSVASGCTGTLALLAISLILVKEVNQ